jgi:hypothetical protein
MNYELFVILEAAVSFAGTYDALEKRPHKISLRTCPRRSVDTNTLEVSVEDVELLRGEHQTGDSPAKLCDCLPFCTHF